MTRSIYFSLQQTKEENVISTDAEKTLHKNVSIPDKTFRKPRIKENFPHLRKDIYEKPTANIVLKNEFLNVFS
jgi:hypothetical protein